MTTNKPFRIDERVVWTRSDGSKKAGLFVTRSQDGLLAYCKTSNLTVSGGWEYWCCDIQDLRHISHIARRIR